MKYLVGDLWDYIDYPMTALCITTNGYIKNNGEAVMGRGCAFQAKSKYPLLPKLLGDMISREGNHVFELIPLKLYSFPVKHSWEQKADIKLIERSAKELDIIAKRTLDYNFILPKPGCGNGGLEWLRVQSVIQDILNDQIFIIDYAETN